MARLCVRVAPNDHPTDKELDAHRTKPGDVVCIVEDGHVFSKAEMTNGQYRIIDVPGVPAQKFIHLTETQTVTDEKTGDETIVALRSKSLDTTILKTTWAERKQATEAQITSIVVSKS